MHNQIKLESIQHNNLPCVHESFYECISRITPAIMHAEGSSLQCGKLSLPSFPVCNETMRQSHKITEFWSGFGKAKKECINKQRLCVTLEYTEKENIPTDLIFDTYLFVLSYEIPSNSTRIYDEYYIYDAINVVGSVGGTLGLCIGFSFTGVFSKFLKFLQHGMMAFKGKS